MNRRGRWALRWRQKGSDGHFIWDYRSNDVTPKMFRTRREAREFRESRYGYIRDRDDLRAAPFNWQMPKVVKVRFFIEEVK